MGNTRADANKQRATDLLVNYFKGIAEKAGMKWDADYTVEVGDAVEAIVDAAVATFRSELNDYKDAVDNELQAMRGRLYR